MFYICIPNINHNHINIISDEYNINISKSNAILIDNYYIYKVDKNLTSGVSYNIDPPNIFNAKYLDENNYNCILVYPTMYDTGFAQIYHDNQHDNDYNDIIMMIGDKVIEASL